MKGGELAAPEHEADKFEIEHLRFLIPHEWALVGGDDAQSECLSAAEFDDRLAQDESKDDYREFER